MAIDWFIALHAAIWPLVVTLGWRGERLYRELPELEMDLLEDALPSLSIIVPARNEVRNLPKLLGSLKDLRYQGELEIIVVDDSSEDGTGLAAEMSGAMVIRLDELPPGWLGKPYACHRAAFIAKGEWLLFTDADTVHAPGSASRAVSQAVRKRLDGLSLFLRQETGGLVDALALVSAFGGLLSGVGSLEGFLNGQYILVRKHAYEQSGGFGSVRGDALEDVAFGQLLSAGGFRTILLRGEKAGRVRMYRKYSQLWNGLTRLGSGTLLHTGSRSILSVVYIAQLASPLVLLVSALSGRMSWSIVLASWLAATAVSFPGALRIGRPAASLLAPVGALLIAVSGVWGLGQRLSGRGNLWKGRRV